VEARGWVEGFGLDYGRGEAVVEEGDGGGKALALSSIPAFTSRLIPPVTVFHSP
jgi:hypothetical protein